MATRDHLTHVVATSDPVGSALGDEYYDPSSNKLFKRSAVNGIDVQWVEQQQSITFQASGSTVATAPRFVNFPGGTLSFDASTGVLDIATSGGGGGGSGDVVGPAAATDNAVARFNLTTGKLIQNSLVTIADDGAITAPNNTSSMIPFYYNDVASFPSATNSHGALAHGHSTGKMYYAHAGQWFELANAADTTNASNLTSGTVPVLRLGASGTRDATTFLRGDNTWATVAAGANDEFARTLAIIGL